MSSGNEGINRKDEMRKLAMEICHVSEHQNEVKIVYCATCQKISCSICEGPSHKGHTKTELGEAIDNKLASIKGKIEETQVKINDNTQILERLDANLTKFKDDISGCIDVIDSMATNSLKAIDEAEAEICQELITESEIHCKQLQDVRDGYATCTSKMLDWMQPNRTMLQQYDVLAITQSKSEQQAVDILCEFDKLTSQECFRPSRLYSSNYDIYSCMRQIDIDNFGKLLMVQVKYVFPIDVMPGGLCVMGNGNIFLTSHNSNQARIIERNGNIARVAADKLARFQDVTVAPNNDVLISGLDGHLHAFSYVGKKFSRKILRIWGQKKYTATNAKIIPKGIISYPPVVACGYTDKMYQYDYPGSFRFLNPGLVCRPFQLTENFVASFSEANFIASGCGLIAFSACNFHLVMVYEMNYCTRYSVARHIFTYGTGKPGLEQGELNSPWGLCVDSKRGVIVVADCFNDRLVVLSTLGELLGYVKFDNLIRPRSCECDQEGHLVVSHGPDEGPWFVTKLQITLII